MATAYACTGVTFEFQGAAFVAESGGALDHACQGDGWQRSVTRRRVQHAQGLGHCTRASQSVCFEQDGWKVHRGCCQGCVCEPQGAFSVTCTQQCFALANEGRDLLRRRNHCIEEAFEAFEQRQGAFALLAHGDEEIPYCGPPCFCVRPWCPKVVPVWVV